MADGTTVKTLWGELAYQLGKKDGYARVARYDENSVPPPTSDIADLLDAYAPCVILIDEWVAYLRQLYSHGTDDPYPAGTFDAHQTFAQSLTEAVKSVDTALLVVSLPASDSVRDMGEGIIGNAYEIGGTPGLEALRSLRSVIHRVETPWQPATVEESYEIVRRRIFKPLTAEGSGGRNLVISKFADYYAGALRGSQVREPAGVRYGPGRRRSMGEPYCSKFHCGGEARFLARLKWYGHRRRAVEWPPLYGVG